MRRAPTGYGLARALQAAGVGCTVAAPGEIERPAQDKIKIDRRAAERVLRLLMIDALHAVRVHRARKPDEVGDLERDDQRGDVSIPRNARNRPTTGASAPAID
jgi:transposase